MDFFDSLWERRGKPPKSGYYLVAWKSGQSQVIVSELWYNPDAIHPWWFTRGYTNQPRLSVATREVMRCEVVGWMPMPDPPKD